VSNDLATASRALVPYLREFNEEEEALLPQLISQMAPKATTAERALFVYTAKKKGLDPFNKQIYLVGRYDSQTGTTKHSIQVSIDGLRLLAQRSHQYAGQLGPLWCGEDGKWVDVWTANKPPVAAKVAILRHDFKEPLWSVALWKSYVQKKKDGAPNKFWNDLDSHMLAKCAEALSLRRGFPEETSGYYIPEEMGNNPDRVHIEEVPQDDTAEQVEGEVVQQDEPVVRQQSDKKETPKGSPVLPQSSAQSAKKTNITSIKPSVICASPPVSILKQLPRRYEKESFLSQAKLPSDEEKWTPAQRKAAEKVFEEWGAMEILPQQKSDIFNLAQELGEPAVKNFMMRKYSVMASSALPRREATRMLSDLKAISTLRQFATTGEGDPQFIQLQRHIIGDDPEGEGYPDLFYLYRPYEKEGHTVDPNQRGYKIFLVTRVKKEKLSPEMQTAFHAMRKGLGSPFATPEQPTEELANVS
jgi:phage recombination protein Bet